MILRRKKPRQLSREERTYRDDRLFIIASEDTHVAAQYFALFRNSRIKVRVLPTKDGLSAPEHVLARLDTYKAEFDLVEEDELWLLLDTDHWIEKNHVATFNRVCSESMQKGYQLAHSNPCFELWLLLHKSPLDAMTQFAKCEDVALRLRRILGGYNKRKLDASHFPPASIGEAILRG